VSARPELPASIHAHGLGAAVSGEGTWWHSSEDRTMGMKAAMLKISGDPVVLFADAASSMFTCGAEEIMRRLNAVDADLVVGAAAAGVGAGGCWPPGGAHCGAGRQGVEQEAAGAGMELRSDNGRVRPDGGLKAAGANPPPAPPRQWGSAGVLIGRKSKMMEVVSAMEGYLATDPVAAAGRGAGARWAAFYKACRAFNQSDAQYLAAVRADGRDGAHGRTYDDQVCLHRYMAEAAAAAGGPAAAGGGAAATRVKVDRHTAILHTVGGTDPSSYRPDHNHKPFWAETMKSPCVWHFNTPTARAYMEPMIEKFPGAFV